MLEQFKEITLKKCDKGHLLKWSTYSENEYAGGEYYCNECGNHAKTADGRFFCEECKYDMCKTCGKKEPEKTIKKCKNGHELAFSTYKLGGYSQGKYACDICHNAYDCKDGRFFCRDCSYDMCKNCGK